MDDLRITSHLTRLGPPVQPAASPGDRREDSGSRVAHDVQRSDRKDESTFRSVLQEALRRTQLR